MGLVVGKVTALLPFIVFWEFLEVTGGRSVGSVGCIGRLDRSVGSVGWSVLQIGRLVGWLLALLAGLLDSRLVGLFSVGSCYFPTIIIIPSG